VRERSQFPDHELCHIRVGRCVIEDIVRRQVDALSAIRQDGMRTGEVIPVCGRSPGNPARN
jgi:hypothetical protein